MFLRVAVFYACHRRLEGDSNTWSRLQVKDFASEFEEAFVHSQVSNLSDPDLTVNVFFQSFLRDERAKGLNQRLERSDRPINLVLGSCLQAKDCHKSSSHQTHGIGELKAALLLPILQLDNCLLRNTSVMLS